MATSPTVLASASSASSIPAPEAAKFPVLPLILAVAVSVAVATLGIGGGLYYLARSGRLSGAGNATRRAAVVAPATTHVLVLEPLLVNLADANGSSYLRIALTLRVIDGADKRLAVPKEEKGKDEQGMNEAVAPVRDTLLTVLGRQTSDQLLATEGKDRLKTTMKAALAERNPDLKVTDLYFTDFLVQR
jgi:flagellar FliL protein